MNRAAQRTIRRPETTLFGDENIVTSPQPMSSLHTATPQNVPGNATTVLWYRRAAVLLLICLVVVGVVGAVEHTAGGGGDADRGQEGGGDAAWLWPLLPALRACCALLYASAGLGLLLHACNANMSGWGLLLPPLLLLPLIVPRIIESAAILAMK